ncbi:MAG: NAD(P)H-dependent oxidoreductase subunit E [Magnetovibrio sp.]|nr:NAD(P)H-dependent oxidoreductase subunit E [Magnetovibrio sp.]
MGKKGKRRSARSFPKGRQPSDADLDVISTLIGDVPKGRDLVIEHLHTIHDHFGHITHGHISALANLLGLAQIDVYETASFYAHFHITEDTLETSSPAVRICNGPACRMAGAAQLLRTTDHAHAAPCQGACDRAPSAMVGKNRISPATIDSLASTTVTPLPPISEINTTPTPNIAQELKTAGLRGMGGAGFPVAKKWAFLKDAPHPRVLVVNADEGEPGTFKDRFLLENEPTKVLRGMVIAAQALSVGDVFIYLRDEYPHIHDSLREALNSVSIDGIKIHLRRGAGAYVCGEETALLNSLEGKRGQPRNRPPYPAQAGYKGRPTVTHNVETLYWIADIAERGGATYAAQRRPRFYSVSGRVQNPGVYLAPATTTVHQLIEMAGGMTNGHTFRAFLPGGASGGLFPARFGDKSMDFGVFEELGGFVGSGALMIFSDHDNLWDVVQNLMQFFADESCGKCTPCRVGTEKMLALISNPDENFEIIKVLAQTMREASICGLGQAAPNPVMSLLTHFEEDEI